MLKEPFTPVIVTSVQSYLVIAPAFIVTCWIPPPASIEAITAPNHLYDITHLLGLAFLALIFAVFHASNNFAMMFAGVIPDPSNWIDCNAGYASLVCPCNVSEPPSDKG